MKPGSLTARAVDVLETYNGEWFTVDEIDAVLGGGINPQSLARALQRTTRGDILKRVTDNGPAYRIERRP